MKFGKRLKHQIQETLPGWRDKFLAYKDLKKLVKLISLAPMLLNGSLEYGKAEAEFVYLLNNEIDKFNAFFMEQEEDFIIRHKVFSFSFPFYNLGVQTVFVLFKVNFLLNLTKYLMPFMISTNPMVKNDKLR